MRIVDISVRLRERMPTYPGDPPFRKAAARSRKDGDAAEVSLLTLSSHAGTHVDVPYHFIEGGADEASAPVSGERILFKTDNGALWGRDEFVSNYVYLTPVAAQVLAARGVALVGWDYLSIEKFGADEAPTHRVLLAAGVMILEGLNLAEVAAGEYFLAAAPLALAEGDGAPARAVLLEGFYAE